MSESRDKNVLKQALQKIQRNERANVRTNRKNIPENPRLAAIARHPSPEIGSPTNFQSSNVGTSSEVESSEIVQASNLLEESSVVIDESENLSVSSVTLESGQTSSSSPITTTPIEYLFSQPKEFSFQNPITEYLSDNWHQQSQSVQERLGQLLHDSSLEDSSSSPHLEISTGQFLLNTGKSESRTSSDTSEVEDIQILLADELRETFQREEIQLRNTMAQQRPLNLVQLPQFLGHAGTDPDQHIARFEIVCAANLIPQASFLITFPATLVGVAQEWYRTHGPFADWNALRNAFLARFGR